MSKISVILPMYNVEDYIFKCINSVIAQSFTDWELIVVDDESRDNSLARAGLISDPRIRTYKKPHGGLSAARNYGLKKAAGDFVYFMDSDDWIEPNLLEENLILMERGNLNFLIFGYCQDFVDKNERLINSHRVIPKKMRIERGSGRFYLDSKHLDLLGYAWNKMYRRSFLQKHQFLFEEGTSLIEDILFNTAVFSKSDSIAFYDRSYYHYMSRPSKSLIKRYYADSFLLIKRKFHSLSRWMKTWEIHDCDAFLSAAIFSGVNYCLYNTFGCGTHLSLSEKRAFVKMMVYDPIVREAARNMIPDSEDMEELRLLVETRNVSAICSREMEKYRTPSFVTEKRQRKDTLRQKA